MTSHRAALRHRFPLLQDLARARKTLSAQMRRAHGRRAHRATIEAWLRAPGPRLLHIGAGPNALPGWLNTDLEPRRARGAVFMDATKPFPLPDGSVDIVFSEHMIEHVSHADGLEILRECRRVLRPGGAIRVATPDLAVLLALYRRPEDLDDVQRAYLRHIVDGWIPGCPRYDPVFVINNAFRAWGHQFLYDEATLRLSLAEAGFIGMERVPIGTSRHAALHGIESHGKAAGGYAMAVFETMALEATKPATAAAAHATAHAF